MRMENFAKASFLDNGITIETVSALITDILLGSEQLPKIILRFHDLKEIFNSVTFDEYTDHSSQTIWKFSSGVTPYRDYDDTSNIPIPITNPIFLNQDNIVSFDLPFWFNFQSSNRIMMISQDPMPRNLKWYSKCRDAICSSTFGLHNASWRKNGMEV